MRFVLLLSFLILAAQPAFAAEKESAYDRVMRTGTFRCGYYPWPPYFNLDVSTHKVTGLAVDVADAIGGLLGLKVEYVQMSAIGMSAEDMKKGLYDSYCLDSYYTFSSIKYLDFSDPHFYAPVFAYVRAGDKRFHTLADLNKPDITFVGIDGDISVEMVQRRFPKAKIHSLPANSDGTQLMMDVLTKKADATVIDPGIIEGFNAHNPPGLQLIAPDDPVAVYPIGFSVLKGEDKLLHTINGAISALQNTGAMKSIVERYNLVGKGIYLVAKPYEVPRPTESHKP